MQEKDQKQRKTMSKVRTAKEQDRRRLLGYEKHFVRNSLSRNGGTHRDHDQRSELGGKHTHTCVRPEIPRSEDICL